MREELNTLDYISAYETWLAQEKRASVNTLCANLTAGSGRSVCPFLRSVRRM